MEEILRIFLGFISTVFFGGLLGFGLAYASRKLKVEKDPKIEALENAMPGLNCGSCGYAGCSGYAEALADGSDEDILKCKPGGSGTLEALGEILGVDVSIPDVKMVAQIHCTGGSGKAGKQFEYGGMQDCNAASLYFQGDKACKYGCLGLGSCINVCPVRAIYFTEDKRIWVDPEKCISCEKCIAVCPTGVLKMIPSNAEFIVGCNSKDKGKTTKENCSVGCIGCKICEKKFPESGFVVEDFCSRLNYPGDVKQQEEASVKCPTHSIIALKELKQLSFPDSTGKKKKIG